MANLTRGYFHCVECETLFEAQVVAIDEQRCPVCGSPPTGKKLASRGRVKRSKRAKKGGNKIVILLVVWFLLMALTIGVVKFFTHEDEDSGVTTEKMTAREKLQEEAELKRSQLFVQKEAPACKLAISQFLNSHSSAGKAQSVYQGRDLTSEMSRYYEKNPTFSSTRSHIKLLRAELLKNTLNQTIGALCANSQEEAFEVIFVRVGEEWKVDWKSIVRFDTRSWSLFPSGSDGDEGEFRLYMRVRDSNKELNTDTINLVFYKPKIYLKGEFRGIPSSTVSVAVDSEVGQKILKLVEREDDMAKDQHGLSTGLLDPPGYHRVRVKMKLNKEGGEHSFELLDILANHWYGADIVEPEEDAAD